MSKTVSSTPIRYDTIVKLNYPEGHRPGVQSVMEFSG